MLAMKARKKNVIMSFTLTTIIINILHDALLPIIARKKKYPERNAHVK